MHDRSRTWLLLLLAIGLVLRLAHDVATFQRPLIGDEPTYDRIAWNLVTGRGYSLSVEGTPPVPTAIRGPGYVLLVAAVQAVTGHHTLPVLILQAFLDTLSAWLVWVIGRRLFRNDLLALGGVAFHVFYPPFILNAGAILTETFTILTLLLAVWTGLRWAIDGWKPGLVLSAVAVGLCGLSKPQLVPIAGCIVLAGRPDWRSRGFWIAGAIAVLTVTLVLSPWIARNFTVYHRFIPGVTLGGMTFWGGTGPAPGGRVIGSVNEPGAPESVRVAVRGMSEVVRDRYFYRQGMGIVRSDPPRYLGLVFRKFFRLWFNLWFEDPPSRASLLLAAFNLGAIVLAIAGIRRERPERAGVRLLVAMIVYFSIVHMAIFANVRYALPCYAFLFVFSGAGAASLVLARRARERSGAPA